MAQSKSFDLSLKTKSLGQLVRMKEKLYQEYYSVVKEVVKRQEHLNRPDTSLPMTGETFDTA